MATLVSTTVAAADDDDSDKKRPYVIVLMSAEMKAAVKEYADAHDTNPTALARKLLAETIGYDLSKEPVSARRSKHLTPEEKKAAHKVASKKSGLIRKALFHVHFAQLNKKPALQAVANRSVMDLSDPAKHLTLADLETMDTELTAAIKAGK